jgi:4-amino-4-deoxy-L-arabinose transferase-like glycosyltransferase
MTRKTPRVAWVCLPLAYFIYFFHLGAVGLLGPDEPRYAAIAREMARSGDWITPRLWGAPWFEKPALLYWMSGAGFRSGLSADLAPRLPVAVLALAFLGFFWWILNREFGCRTAWFGSVMLGTSIAWVGFSQVGVTDLPLAAFYAAAMLLALPWVGRGETRFLPWAAASLGAAVLAKSLVPVVLSAPIGLALSFGRGKLRDLVRPRVILPFVLVAAPWYALCYLRNGRVFWETLFVQHQFGRFTSDALKHPGPWWFYVPILAGLLVPWTPVAGLLAKREGYRDPRRLFLLVSVLFGLAFFSAATNKLPGYVLPLLPAAAALMAIALDEAPKAGWWLAGCAALLVVFAVAAPVLPEAVANGLSRAPRPAFRWTWLLPIPVMAAVWISEMRSRRVMAVVWVAAAATAGVVYLKEVTTPELGRLGSARGVWEAIAGRAGDVCVGTLKRDLRYGLNYYSGAPLPDCSQEPRPLRVEQLPGMPPSVMAASGALTGAIIAPSRDQP